MSQVIAVLGWKSKKFFIPVNEMNAQRAKFHLRKVTGPREAKYRALMKYQRAKGIVDTLRWTIGVRGQKSPLKEGLGD